MIIYPEISLRCEFEIVEIGDEVTAVCVGDEKDDYHGVIKLNNESARFMFGKLQEGITLPDLIKACMEEYEGSTVEEVGPKVIEFLDKLGAQNLLAVNKEKGVCMEDDADGGKK